MNNLSSLQPSKLQPRWTHAVCVLAAPVYLDIEIKLQSGTSIGYSTLSEFLRAILPTSLNESTSGDMCDWWAKNWSFEVEDTTDFVKSIDQNCHDEVCDAVAWPGDPDIAGIGMIVVYLTLLSLVLLYTIVDYLSHYTMFPCVSRHRTAEKVKEKKEFMSPFAGTLQDFVDLSLCFSLTAEISTLAFHSRAVTRYEMVIAELLCLFASSACAVLWIFHAQGGRFRITRFFLFLTSAVLPVAVAIEHGTMRGSMAKDFLMTCVDTKLEYLTTSRLRDGLLLTAWAITIVLQVGFGMIVLPSAVHNYKVALRPESSLDACEPGEDRTSTSESNYLQRSQRLQRSKWFKFIRATGTTFGCITMIACIVEIWRLRKRMQEAAGSSYNENDWAFGQVYALTTWFPMLPAFFAIVIKGPQNGFDSRLPEAWKAIKKSAARCGCAAGPCQCRKSLKSSQTAAAKGPKLRQTIVSMTTDGNRNSRPELKGAVAQNECCRSSALESA